EVNPYKARLARDLPPEAATFEGVMQGADAFIGCSVAGALTEPMLRAMAPDPIVFALANPEPEMPYAEIRRLRPDAVVATGRSDHPNQVNNVLGFPYIFRGALDVRATTVNEAMKRAAVEALAALAKQEVSDEVRRAYPGRDFTFGREYLIPTPFDSRVLLEVAPAVAAAAMASGVARRRIHDLQAYRDHLEGLLGPARQLRRTLIRQAQAGPRRRICFPEAKETAILRACQILLDEGICQPILLGRERQIRGRIEELGLELEGAIVIDPRRVPERETFAEELYRLNQRRGLTRKGAARRLDQSRNLFALMMVRAGLADGMLTGATRHYQEVIGPILAALPPEERRRRIAGVYCLVYERRVLLLGDTTLHIDPTPEQLAEIACGVVEVAEELGIPPRVAFVSYGDYGSVRHGSPERVRRAVALFREMRPEVEADGEMQADTAVSAAKREANFPFSLLSGDANCLVFPNLDAGNAAYKLLARLSECEAIGPILAGMPYAVNVLQLDPTPEEVVDMAVITSLAARR
ncbi:MAG: NADP-dependent malic enzyme, partial [Nitrospirae bacterium]